MLKLIQQLSSILQQVPADKKHDVESVMETTQQLFTAATRDKPNPSILKIAASGLRQAVESVADVVPKVIRAATQIIEFVTKFTA